MTATRGEISPERFFDFVMYGIFFSYCSMSMYVCLYVLHMNLTFDNGAEDVTSV